ncbi:FAD binding domain-containing protein [Trichophyton tonsurans CBS 112818]|uniref:FAD binding domain-containing protein n=2 Tax=Trichophyton TaxID=5550 RepID=F2PPQ2_TRIEC|nr:FAD binding domain-containing protein [Trichophyton tonsurans CBS 112818]EGE03870.1 FAD binding domain-containing protein [Trichophyton equinum CBS 127.97]
MRSAAYLTALLSFLGATHAAPEGPRCRCTPDQSCWPSPGLWQTLNKTLSGNLVAVKPVGAVCHDPTYNGGLCDSVKSMETDSSWRSAQPGAVQSINWETWPEKNESCYIDGPRQAPCGQGRIPLYSAVVQFPLDIQKTVRFASKYNLRLVIKNTGHDFLGRSTGPQSLQILTHNMKSINFTDNFVPEGKLDGRGIGQAVTIGAGVQLYELYEAAGKRGLTQVIGLSTTVGAAGGYIQGGGHSPLGPWKGMSTDHVLEYKVVTAGAKFVTANEYQNSDLFWALRGGGGGTFGVVTSVTLRTFKDPPTIVSQVNVTMGGKANESYWDAVEKFQAYLPTLSDGGCSGYYYMLPNVTLGPQSAAVIIAAFYYANKTDKAHVDNLYKPLFANLSSIPGINVASINVPVSSSTEAFRSVFDQKPPRDGGGVNVLGSRLFSRKLLETPGGAGNLTAALSKLDFKNLQPAIGHLVAGGQVAKNTYIQSALNPSWRKALVHLVISRDWSIDSTFAEQERISAKLTAEEIPLLAAVEPDMGAYTNEADVNEPRFQQTFWGTNYNTLLRVKNRWDPRGLFFVRSGVGSEAWDKQGLCRA